MPGSREGIGGGQYSSTPMMYGNQNVQSMQIDAAENAYSSAVGAAPSSDKQRESVIMRQEQEFMEQERRNYEAARHDDMAGGGAEMNMAPT